MKTYFALFCIATVASLVTTPLIRRFCQRYKLLDIPLDGRHIHRTAVPRLGGFALYLSCLTALSLLPFVDNLLTQTLSGLKPEFLTLFVPATLVLLLGGYDDLKGTNAVVTVDGREVEGGEIRLRDDGDRHDVTVRPGTADEAAELSGVERGVR